jgi:hypothetical protein
MAAIYTALRLAVSLDRCQGLVGRNLCVFGFPYIDTLKLVQRSEFNENGWLFYGIYSIYSSVEYEHIDLCSIVVYREEYVEYYI